MRAVLDPNVLISALLAPNGAPAQALSRWVGGEYDLVVSPFLLAELERALAYPKLRARIAPEAAGEIVSFLERAAILMMDREKSPRRSSDPGDDYLLALAEQAKAEGQETRREQPVNVFSGRLHRDPSGRTGGRLGREHQAMQGRRERP